MKAGWSTAPPQPVTQLLHDRTLARPCFPVRMIVMRRFVPLVLMLLSVLAGCATPVGVKVVSPREAYQNTFENPLSSGVASNDTNVVLNRFNLSKKFRDSPAEAIAALHEKALTDDRRDILFALAETAYLHGEQLAKSEDSSEQRDSADYFLLAAIYSYQFLLGDRPEPPPHELDPRLRTAANLYNFSLWRGFSTGDNGRLVLDAQTRRLPIGKLTISHKPETFPWKFEEFERFEPAEKYIVRGLSNRNRAPGMGMPLIGLKKSSTGAIIGGVVEPVTVFLRADSRLAEFKTGTAHASLEFYSTFDVSDVDVKGKSIPLETDTSTVIAYKLEGSQLWNFGIGAFLGKEFSTIRSGLYQLGPHQPGRIPVVLVHGTASSPVWWAEMINTLYSDPTIRRKFQFWYFVYKSNNAVVISAGELRTALQEKVASLDPEGKDAALRQMVVIGHSQGGLLTKLTAVDTGDNLVRAMTGKGIGQLETSEKNRKQIRELLVLKPLPFVKQVIFIATPHRGSFLSTQLVRKLIAKLVRLPRTVLTMVTDFGGVLTDEVKRQLQGRIPTSIDGMSPDNPLLKALAAIPIGPGIRGHSIIAIKDESMPPEGDDGVVKYTSAHLEGMDSEFIVRSKHSCQGHPFTIEEVRRILLEHLGIQVTGPTQEAPAADPAHSEFPATTDRLE